MSYLQKCWYTEEFEPEHTYTFTGKCVITGEDYSVTVRADGLWDYNHGTFVQDAFPELSREDREFIISGTSPKGVSDRIKCPRCGIPTIEDDNEDVAYEEMLCDDCYAGTCARCHRELVHDVDDICMNCQIGQAESREDR